MCHPALLPPELLAEQCVVTHTRRRGPGGQHRNKTATAVVVVHQPTGCRAEASERRSQQANRKTALHRLRIRLALEIRTAPVAARSDRWQRRTTGGRLAVDPQHDDFPALLAESLDVVDRCDYDLAAAAQQCGVTTSQLAKFLKIEPRAWQLVNAERTQRGQRPWR